MMVSTMMSVGLLLTLSGSSAAEAPAASQPAAKTALKIKAGEQIVAMGDSITAAGGYLRVINAVFAQQYPDLKIPKIINVGIGGQKAEDMVVRFKKDVVDRKPAIVTINVGINDVWHRLNAPHDPQVLMRYKRNLEAMVKMAQDAGIRVLILSPTIIQEDVMAEGNQRLKMYVKAGQEIARERKCTFVNLREMFLKVLKNRSAASTQPTEGGRQLTVDGVHMKPMGDTLMAVGVLHALGVPDEKIKDTDLSKVFGKK